MKKRAAVFLCVLSLVLLTVACGGKYSDIISVNKQFAKVMETYVTALEKAESAKDVAAAINRFADGMESLAPEMKAINKKYPELRGDGDLPEELEQSRKETEAVSQRYAESFMKMMPYMADPDVQAAQMRLSKVMSEIGQE
ncbi:hypothetical protein [Desulfosudis oleivorans]|uniref:Lipoprotein n=1 Tax=Desulfosudis oleivorans (strain DSM 6200 / JCM 39069 / Hxd3) TaxID=96561 RepID=A8ZYE3_DESOH|nr:hypothetical protein [Desulfosudis oleivorans]ABW68668.1 hypothetical protein Dole_2865 [Desulfosudis oleivorans Hxd3]